MRFSAVIAVIHDKQQPPAIGESHGCGRKGVKNMSGRSKTPEGGSGNRGKLPILGWIILTAMLVVILALLISGQKSISENQIQTASDNDRALQSGFEGVGQQISGLQESVQNLQTDLDGLRTDTAKADEDLSSQFTTELASAQDSLEKSMSKSLEKTQKTILDDARSKYDDIKQSLDVVVEKLNDKGEWEKLEEGITGISEQNQALSQKLEELGSAMGTGEQIESVAADLKDMEYVVQALTGQVSGMKLAMDDQVDLTDLSLQLEEVQDGIISLETSVQELDQSERVALLNDTLEEIAGRYADLESELQYLAGAGISSGSGMDTVEIMADGVDPSEVPLAEDVMMSSLDGIQESISFLMQQYEDITESLRHLQETMPAENAESRPEEEIPGSAGFVTVMNAEDGFGGELPASAEEITAAYAEDGFGGELPASAEEITAAYEENGGSEGQSPVSREETTAVNGEKDPDGQLPAEEADVVNAETAVRQETGRPAEGRTVNISAFPAGEVPGNPPVAETAEDEYNEIETGIAQITNRLESLDQAVCAALDGQAAAAEDQDQLLSDLQQDILELSQAHEVLAGSVAQLTTEADSASENMDSIGQEVAAISASVTGLSEELSGLKTEVQAVSEAVSGIAELSGQTAENSQTLAELSSGVDFLEKSAASLDEKFGALGQALAYIGTEVGTLDETASGMETELAAIGETVTGTATEVGTLGDAVTGTAAEIGALDETVSAIGTDVADLGQTVAAVESEVTDLNGGISGIDQGLKGLEESTASVNDRITALEESASAMNESITGLETSSENGIEKAGNSFASIDGRLSALEDAVFSLDAGIAAAQEETSGELKEQMASVDAQLTEIVDAVSAVCAALDDNTADVDIKKQVDLLESKVDALSGQYESANEKLDVLMDVLVPKEEPEAETTIVEYEVKSGDTLLGICNSYGLDYYEVLDEIKELNQIENPSLINPGQKILLPLSSAGASGGQN